MRKAQKRWLTFAMNDFELKPGTVHMVVHRQHFAATPATLTPSVVGDWLSGASVSANPQSLACLVRYLHL